MQGDSRDLPPEARAIVEEEQEIFERVRAALEEASQQARRKARGGDLRSVDALRQLREEALRGSDDDLPALLLEMSVRKQLLERPAEPPLPDPLSPYMAHLRVVEGSARKDYLLGRTSFFDVGRNVRVVDWRVAPVAQIFYRYREGDGYEETFPGRVAEGVVEARRIVVIAGGSLQQIIGGGHVLVRDAEGLWSTAVHGDYALAAGGAGTAARAGSLGVGAGAAGRRSLPDVTALMDPEQFAAVGTPPSTPLLVLGSAGSGKTTVALHRFARIAAEDPAHYPLSRMEVVVPEEGLARLSRRLLEPLGVGVAQVRTVDAWASGLAAEVFGEPLSRLCTEPPALVASLKRHPSFHDALRARIVRMKRGPASLRRLRRRLAELLTDRPFLEGIVAASRGDLPRTAVEDTVAHTLLQLAEPVEKMLASIVVPEMTRAIDGKAISEGTPDELAGTVDLEDLPILLFMRACLSGLDAPGLAHVVLDEAEDFSLCELHVLGELLGETRSVTLAGDEAQQTLSSFGGWDASLKALGVRDAAICRLSVSYRCPQPVAFLARSILGSQGAEGARSARLGAPVGIFRFPGESQAHLFLSGAVRDLVAREPNASVAVIARDADSARRLQPLWADMPEARLVLGGDFSFEPGIDVTDVDNVKGLEFDYVIVPDASAEAYPDTAEARRRLHVAVTRTSHQLWVLSSGTPSPILPKDAAPGLPAAGCAVA